MLYIKNRNQFMMEPHDDPICILIEKPFCEWREDDKLWAIKNGRPTPTFGNKLVMTESIDNASSPQPSWYELFPWLCGSLYLKKLFCWPCLINGIESHEMDSVDFDSVTEQLLNVHEASLNHLKSALKLKELSLQVPHLYKKCFSLNIVEHNKISILNRRLMQLLIKAILFFTERQLPMKEHIQKNIVSSNDNFKELLNLFICESPFELQQHYSNVKTYLESESVKNDLIYCLCNHINDFVIKEASKSLFYSFELDRVSQSHCSIMVRYVTSNGLVVVRPLGILCVNKSCSNKEFFKELEAILYPLNYQNKLVAQCYDGAIVLKGKLNELQYKVKSQAPQALFVHSCSHKFNEIIVQSVNDIPECRVFFTKLYSIPYFFNSSAKRLETLNSAITKGGIKIVIEKNQLSPNYEIISTVYKNYLAFKEAFKNILSNPSFDYVSYRQANTYLKYFKDMEYIFLSLVFKFIFEVMEGLLKVLQIQMLDMSFALNKVDEIQVTLTKHRTSRRFGFLYKYSKDRAEVVLIDQEEYYDREDVRQKFKQLYFKILDSVAHELDIRFKDYENLLFMCLAEWSNFKSFSKVLPDSYIQPLIDLYPNVMTNIDRLRNELKLFYTVVPYNECSIQEIIKKMNEDKSFEIFKEVYKLFSLIITLPCIDVSTDNHISSPQRIQNYLKNCNHYGEFQTSHAMLSIGQEVIDHLITTSMFYDDVIDQFVSLRGQKIPLSLLR